MPVVLTRRAVLASSLAAGSLLILPTHQPAAAARQTDLASLDLPTLDVAVTPETFEGVPESIAAGRYLLNVSGYPNVSWFSSAGLVMPPTGTSLEDALPLIENLNPNVALPDIAYEATYSGGVIASSGATTSVVIDLTPGTWAVWGNDLESPQIPVPLTVTGAYPDTVPEPEADATFVLTDFAIALEGNITSSGKQVIRTTSKGEPHFVRIMQAPAGTTNDDATALFSAPSNDTSLTWDDLIDFTFIPLQSDGVTTWRNLEFLPGTYVAICGFFTTNSITPHFAHGMHTVFEVA